MEKEFIHYEQALALKELGFDEPCFGFYVPLLNGTQELEIKLIETHGKKITLAPTFSQAFRWFREKYDLTHGIDTMYMSKGKEWDCHIGKISGESSIWNKNIKGTYEEAELECLKKLIKKKKG